jgi:hypothetical protein
MSHMKIQLKEVNLILGLQIVADYELLLCVLFCNVMGQGFVYHDMENNTVTAEICCFTNFLNMKWQNKTKSSGDKTGLAIYTVPNFFFC